MKKLTFSLGLATLALAFVFFAHDAAAQQGGFGGGNFGGGAGGGGGGFASMMGDPTQRAQTQVDALRDTLAVTNDAEWAVISPRLLKVVQLKSDDTMAEVSRMMASMMAQFGGGMPGRASPFGSSTPDPSADALQQALDGNGTVAQVKAALAKFRDAKKQKQAALAQARDALKEVLSLRQEAALTLAGYLE
jgi:hypothetical protein